MSHGRTRDLRPFEAEFTNGPRAIAWSRDGQQVVEQGFEGVAIRDGHTLRLHRFLTRTQLGWTGLEDEEPPRVVALVRHQLALVSKRYDGNGGSWDQGVEWRDEVSGARLALWPAARLTDDGHALYFTDGRGRFRVFSFESERWFTRSLPLRVSDTPLSLYSAEFKKAEVVLPWGVYFSPDGRHAADQTGDGRLRLWDAMRQRQVCTLQDWRGSYLDKAGARGPIVWSQDARRVATLGEDPQHRNIVFEQGPNDGSINEHAPVVKVWDAHSGKLLTWWHSQLSSDEAGIALHWLDNQRLAVGTTDKYEVWEVRQKHRLIALPAESNLELGGVGALSPDGARFAVSAHLRGTQTQPDLQPTTVLLQAHHRGAWVQTRPGSEGIERLAWSNDGKFLALTTEGENGGVRVWQWNPQRQRPQALVGSFAAFAPDKLAWTHSGRVWTSNFYQIYLWDSRHQWRLQTRKTPHVDKSPFDNGFSGPPSSGLLLTPNERTLLQLSEMRDEVWRQDGTNAPTLWLKAPRSGGFIESVSPDGRFYVVPVQEGSRGQEARPVLRLYDLQVPGRSLRLVESPRNVGDGYIGNFAKGSLTWDSPGVFAGDGHSVAFGGRVYALPSGTLLAERRTPYDGTALALSYHGTRLLRRDPRSKGGGLWVFNARTGARLVCLSRDVGEVRTAAFSPDDHILAVARRGTIEFYNAESGALLANAAVLSPSRPLPGGKGRKGLVWSTS